MKPTDRPPSKSTSKASAPSTKANQIKERRSLRRRGRNVWMRSPCLRVTLMNSFTGVLKLHSILLRSSSDASAPKTLKLYLNRDDLDFSTASDSTPTQTLELSQTAEIQDLPVKRALFGNTYSLGLFIEENYGDEVTRIYWIGFKGEFMRLNREPVEVLYEKAANPRDHTLVQGVGDMAAKGTRHGM
ncbi:MAG: hypothetical protein Q9223_000028 [Gallowayella weberi]